MRYDAAGQVSADDIVGLLRTGGPTVVFQPIFDAADLQIVGYEALARFPEGTPGPERWFGAAARLDMSGALEGAALLAALAAAEPLPSTTFLAVNLSSAALTQDPLLTEPLRHAVKGRRIVLEISERSRIADTDTVLDLLDGLRAAGIALALDDVGAGYSGLRQVVTVRPDMIKFDAFVTRGIDTDPLRRAIAESTVALADQFNIRVVFEGIETDEELHTVRRLGAVLLQGYHLGRPSPANATPPP